MSWPSLQRSARAMCHMFSLAPWRPNGDSGRISSAIRHESTRARLHGRSRVGAASSGTPLTSTATDPRRLRNPYRNPYESCPMRLRRPWEVVLALGETHRNDRRPNDSFSDGHLTHPEMASGRAADEPGPEHESLASGQAVRRLTLDQEIERSNPPTSASLLTP
jgi:hypothetical protein